MKKTLTSALLIGALSINLAFAAPQDAVNQIRTNADQVLNILSKSNGSNKAQIIRQAEAYAAPYFDFERITQSAVGSAWRTATPAQKQQLTQEFRKLLVRVYSNVMFQYKDAKVQISEQPVVRGNLVDVSSTVNANGKAVNIGYTLRQKGGKYLIVDVKPEGASIFSSYRNQFAPVIQQKGLDGLIQTLKAKNNGN